MAWTVEEMGSGYTPTDARCMWKGTERAGGDEAEAAPAAAPATTSATSTTSTPSLPKTLSSRVQCPIQPGGYVTSSSPSSPPAAPLLFPAPIPRAAVIPPDPPALNPRLGDDTDLRASPCAGALADSPRLEGDTGASLAAAPSSQTVGYPSSPLRTSSPLTQTDICGLLR